MNTGYYLQYTGYVGNAVSWAVLSVLSIDVKTFVLLLGHFSKKIRSTESGFDVFTARSHEQYTVDGLCESVS
jgi:hypothetical protein